MILTRKAIPSPTSLGGGGSERVRSGDRTARPSRTAGPRRRSSPVSRGAIIGVSDHNGWAVLVTVADNGTLLDRRRVELVGADLPRQPHHHEAQGLPLGLALDLVERVRLSADRYAKLGLDVVARAVPSPIRGIALRECPRLPETTAAQLVNYRAQNVADSVMYRKALARAAQSRGWSVHWYDAKRVLDAACRAQRVPHLDARFLQIRKRVGPPWGQDHRIAMAAAIVAAAREKGVGL